MKQKLKKLTISSERGALLEAIFDRSDFGAAPDVFRRRSALVGQLARFLSFSLISKFLFPSSHLVS